MASSITMLTHLTNLRRDISEQHTAGGNIDGFADGFKDVALAVARSIPEFAFADRTDRIDVTIITGIQASASEYALVPGDPADPIGIMDVAVTVEAPDVALYDYQAVGSPGRAFIDGMADGIPSAFQSAGGQAFLEAVSAEGGMVVEYGVRVKTSKR